MKNILFLTLALILYSTSCSGQSKEEYRRIIAEQNQNNRDQVTSFLNAGLSDQERLTAVEKVFTANDPKQIESLKTIAQNGQENSAIRGKAIQLLQNQLLNDAPLTRNVIDLIKNKNVAPELRNQAFDVINNLSFSLMGMRDLREEILGTLRESATDDDLQLREKSLSYLTAYGDDYARRLLIDGLNDPEKALLSIEKSINLLSQDLHGDAYPAIYKYLNNGSSPAVRLAAINALGGYQNAKSDLIKIARSKEEAEVMRKASLGSLNANYGEEFASIVLPIVQDNSNPEELRAFAIYAEMKRRNRNDYKNGKFRADQFDRAVQNLQNESTSPILRNAASRYLNSVKPQF